MDQGRHGPSHGDLHNGHIDYPRELERRLDERRPELDSASRLDLEFKGLGKLFPGVHALDDVSFTVRGGSVHALCGENGAGKSTLLKILSGVYVADAGEVRIGGHTANWKTPAEALNEGIAVIYQELNLVPELSVAENIFLGNSPSKGLLVNRVKLREQAIASLDLVGLRVDPATKVGKLSIAQRQMVEIAKAVSRNARVIAFDEPTSSLSHQESETLFSLIEMIRRPHRVVLYVSHRMDEILRICNSATVLRDGCHVVTYDSLEGKAKSDLVEPMVGRKLEDNWGFRERKIGGVVLDVRDVVCDGLAQPALLQIRRGEIVGMFGLMGAGRSELLRGIFGEAQRSGSVLISEGELAVGNPDASIRSGMIFCPEDRKKEGIIPLRSVMDNINLRVRSEYARGGIITPKQEKEHAQKQSTRLRVKTPSVFQTMSNLSGGNQQKAILARWLSLPIKVALLDEPTRGIDVGAKREIYEIAYELAEQGVAVLWVSSELPEVMGVCDRILVMREGKIVADVAREDANERAILELALPEDQANLTEVSA
ncbi:MAG: L-arabinose ABC transporter ATP-binding protein AraG [Fimbriimonadaceae bacterium]|nr:L-arabinose ABC transporter ATP-binding protein AraG [Fimbriimonadaceae bacterium]